MKTFVNQSAQGDLLITRLDKWPDKKNLVRKDPENGKLIVAHSETGHHHYLAVKDTVEYFVDPDDPLTCYLRLENPVNLVHDRSWATHETIQIPAGIFEFRRQEENSPRGWRMVQD